MRLERERLAARALEHSLRQVSQPSDSAIRAYFESHRADFDRPRRWQLAHLFKELPADASDSERHRLRQVLENARGRIQDGEDFGAGIGLHDLLEDLAGGFLFVEERNNDADLGTHGLEFMRWDLVGHPVNLRAKYILKVGKSREW